MAETLVAEQWLYTVLSGDPALAAVVGARIYADVAPQGTAFPYVVYKNLSDRDVRGTGPTRIMANMLYAVHGVNATTTYSGALETIANRIDAVLQAASGTNSRGIVVACVREQEYKLAESLDTGQYRNLGGIYRLWAR